MVSRKPQFTVISERSQFLFIEKINLNRRNVKKSVIETGDFITLV